VRCCSTTPVARSVWFAATRCYSIRRRLKRPRRSDDVDATGRRVTVYSVDFLISGATECISDAKAYIPKSGDRISLIEALGEQVFTGYDDSDGAAAAILVDAVADVRIYDPGGNEVAAGIVPRRRPDWRRAEPR